MPPATAPTLTDGPVTLRHPQESDVQGSWEQCQDPLSQQWTTVPIPYSHDDARDFILGFVPGAWESDKEWGFVVEAEGGMPDTSACATRAAAAPRSPTGRTPGSAAPATWKTRFASAARLGLPREGPGHRDLAGQPRQLGLAPAGVEAPRLLVRGNASAVAAPSAASSATPGSARCWPTTRASRSAAGSTTRCSDGPGVRLRPFREEDAARVVEAALRGRAHPGLAGRPALAVPARRPALEFIRGRSGRPGHRQRRQGGGRGPGYRRVAGVGGDLRPDRRPGLRRGG